METSAVIVESFRFADVVRLWARERLVHEVLVSKELVKGIVAEGLRFQSADPAWVSPNEPFRGYPYVGFVSLAEEKPIVIRASALEHLLSVMRSAIDPSPALLTDEVVTKGDFRQWLVRTGRPLPAFWYGAHERAAA
jgi:hypothetical protein